MDIIATIEADAEKVIAAVKADLVWLQKEGEAAIAWVDKTVPGAQVAMAGLVQEAETDAGVLAKLSAQGLNNAIAAGGDDMQTILLNLINASGLAKGAGASGQQAATTLSALDTVGVNTLKTIAQSLVSTGLVSLLAKLAPAVAAAV